MFAIAEKCSDPRILVMRYPDFVRVGEMPCTGTTDKYLSLVFTESDYLVSLTGLPNYEIQLWCWRTNEQLLSIPSGMDGPKQILKCSPAQPIHVVQLAEQSSQLIVWEVSIGAGKGYIQRQPVQLVESGPPYTNKYPKLNPVFSYDATLYLVNTEGDILKVLLESRKLESVIEWPGFIGDNATCACWYKNGILVSGPNGELRFFSNEQMPPNAIISSERVLQSGNGNEWRTVWKSSGPPDCSIRQLDCAIGRDTLLCWTSNGGCFEFTIQFDSEEPTEFHKIAQFNMQVGKHNLNN
ncbi:uncharacterized protein LOC113391198 [Ctenocephalides felis]|uniref:uncharacterized protein LOC113391198 n=1 Tax=Ctenocephalides felis TaxID=7515 RepID=UPI000E6E489B|nr:uncharacterized protein LOC113391198 [Ctenocephalides felis]